MSRTGHGARIGKKEWAYRGLVGKPEGTRPLGRHRRRWENNIKMDIKDIGWEGADWIHLAQDRALVNKRRNKAVVIPNAVHSKCVVHDAVLFTRGGNKCEAGHKNSTAHILEKLKSRRFRIGKMSIWHFLLQMTQVTTA